MKRESLAAYSMGLIVSGYVYFVAFILVLYMMSSLIAGVLALGVGLLELASSPSGVFSTPALSALEIDLLHTIAFTIVLVKAYRILISYAETRRVNLKFLVEISIIGPTVELIFNTGSYNLPVNILFATFAFCNLVAYLYFYKTLKKVSDDYEKECAATSRR